MNAESLIKGRVAGLIVGLLFEEAGYTVIRYGYEGAPEALAKVGELKKGKILEVLSSTPHFVVADKERGETHLVSVRFQGDMASGRSLVWGYGKATEHWPGSEIIIVRPSPPHFFIIGEGKGGLKLIPIPESKTFRVKGELIKKYGQLARKFLN
jgi:hypothetical protein